jgi:hypothetical protein
MNKKIIASAILILLSIFSLNALIVDGYVYKTVPISSYVPAEGAQVLIYFEFFLGGELGYYEAETDENGYYCLEFDSSAYSPYMFPRIKATCRWAGKSAENNGTYVTMPTILLDRVY